MELVLTTQFDGRFIKQAWQAQDDAWDPRPTLTQRVIDLEEAGVRAALISMGWTPPPEVACGSPITP